MNIIAIILVLLFCFTEATYNTLIRKKMAEKGSLWKKRSAGLAGLVSGIAALGLLIYAFLNGGPELAEGWWQPIIITGALVSGVVFCEFKSLSLADASLVVPISALTPALVVITSFIILGESPSLLGGIGILLMAVGIYLLKIQDFLGKREKTDGKLNWRDWLAPLIALSKSKGVRFAFLGVLFAIFALNFEAIAVRKINVAFASGCIFAIGALFNLALAHLTEKRLDKELVGFLKNRYLFAIALCMLLGVLAVNTAVRYDIVPYVGALKRLQIPLTIAFAAWFLKERTDFKSRLLGGITMAVGAILIAAG